MASLDRDYLQYAVYWPAPAGAQPASPQWTQDGVPSAWRAARFTPADGKVPLGGPGFLYYVPAMHGPNPPPEDSASQAYPARCPRCDADWSRRQIGSPVPHAADRLPEDRASSFGRPSARHCGPPAPSQSRKLVVFSDSRQDAAKLSAGMRFSHYRDALRQAITERDRCPGSWRAGFRGAGGADSRCRLSNRHSPLRSRHAPSRSSYALDGAKSSHGAVAVAIASWPHVPARRRNRSLTRAAQGPFHIGAALRRRVSAAAHERNESRRLHARSSVDRIREQRTGSWRDLYIWGAAGTIAADQRPAQLTQAEQRSPSQNSGPFVRSR